MKRLWNSICGKASGAVTVLLCGVLICQPGTAEGESFLTPRRSLGLIFLGSSAVLVKQGLDFKDEADEFYDRYKAATEPEETDRLYRKTNNRDVKSQVSWALAAAFAISGVRLLIAKKADTRHEQQSASRVKAKAAKPGAMRGLRFEPRLDPGKIGFDLKKDFF